MSCCCCCSALCHIFFNIRYAFHLLRHWLIIRTFVRRRWARGRGSSVEEGVNIEAVAAAAADGE